MVCDECKGTGYCSNCGGNGNTEGILEGIVGGMLSSIPGEADFTCEECKGTGKCQECGGSGTTDD